MMVAHSLALHYSLETLDALHLSAKRHNKRKLISVIPFKNVVLLTANSFGSVKFHTDGDFCVIFGAISGGMEFNTGGVVGGVLF